MTVTERQDLAAELSGAVGARHVLTDPAALAAYACDGFTLVRAQPSCVVLPGTTEEVQAVLRILARRGVPCLARGTGSSLSGGATPLAGAVVLHLSRMNAIGEIDLESGWVEVQPGVINAHVSQAVEPYGFFYAPDPASQQACTIGGNLGENAGGPHCLKYGVTLNHVLMAEVVLADGSLVRLGNLGGEPDGLDLLGLLIGSEGTFGIVTRAWLRIVRRPSAVSTVLALFDDVQEAGRAVSDVIAAGIVPAALEMMDAVAITAVEAGAHPVGYPSDVAGVLIAEVDGAEADIAEETEEIVDLMRRHGVREVRRARDAGERDLWWRNRKTAFGAMGNISPRYHVQDGVVPRSRLPEALRRVGEIARRHGLRVANVFHAGDGNLHPLLLYDDRDPRQVEAVLAAGSEILAACVDLGGSITSEHGVGIEKLEDMPRQFGAAELDAQRAVKRAFDPVGLLNPGKVLPAPAAQGLPGRAGGA